MTDYQGGSSDLRHRDKRDGHLLHATIQSNRMGERPIIIRNLARRGIGARTLGVAPIEGEEVVVRFDGRELIGRVRWVRGQRFGIHMRDVIDGEDFSAETSVWTQREPPSPGFHVFDCF